jgi:cytochrome c oxidase assembly factor CtaG
MRALEVLAMYVTPFLILGAVVRLWMKRYAVDLRDVQRQGGGSPRRRFLLGVWHGEG